ncbi:MAG TPA: sugar ABC transporter ATP-binding protein [Terriglobia bacterium]|nr:sugar ABC transporter ATP-binding protein [Terriglobia bacterium]
MQLSSAARNAKAEGRGGPESGRHLTDLDIVQLEARDLEKYYGNTRALKGVSLTLTSGCIHALVGENGAGKSTLLKILAGSERQDRGTILLDSAPYRPRNLGEAGRRGVALVFQELTINPSLSIAENVFIDRLRSFANGVGWIDRARMEQEAQRMLDEIGAEISVRQDLASLDLGKWKCIEICRALSNRPSILFFDESTAFLGRKEVEAVLGAMRRLRDQGLTIAFVSHHLDEVTDVADTLTILKDGKLVGTFDASEVSGANIHAMMVGRAVSDSIYPPKVSVLSRALVRRERLEISDLRLGSDSAGISLLLREGEILGLAGLKGAGGERLFGILSGDTPELKGCLRLEGRSYAPRTPADAWAAGIAHLPGDRGGEGLILDFPVQDNLVMASIPRWGPLFRFRSARTQARQAVASLGVRPSDPTLACRALSGGNMQKVVLGKCLLPNLRVLLLNNPTRGVDVGAREDIYRIIRGLVDRGTSVLLLSEDLPELLGMSDRLAVLRRGEVTRLFEVGEAVSEEDVVRVMV